jgi:hypothetical protein
MDIYIPGRDEGGAQWQAYIAYIIIKYMYNIYIYSNLICTVLFICIHVAMTTLSTSKNGFPVFSTNIEANFVQRKGGNANTDLSEEDKRIILRLSQDPQVCVCMYVCVCVCMCMYACL